MNLEQANELFVKWLSHRMTKAGRGDEDFVLDVEPSGKYWLGRLQSAGAVAEHDWGDRGERLEPCAVGVRLKPRNDGPWTISLSATARVWVKDRPERKWRKTERIEVEETVDVPKSYGVHGFCENAFRSELDRVTGIEALAARFDIEVERGQYGDIELNLTLVNCSPKKHRELDTRLYECELRVSGIETKPFMLESLEDSFRYDRKVLAYGINCGVKNVEGSWVTEDAVTVDKYRPGYWNVEESMPNLQFDQLGRDSLTSAEQLLCHLKEWGERNWSSSALDQRSRDESWTDEMCSKADAASKDFKEELERMEYGINLLRQDEKLLSSFMGMNRAMMHSANGKYDSWRPFQFGFMLANLNSIVDTKDEPNVADVVWFATGGGKTETYLGLLITAALYDRLNGKISGITAWSRFPLRMLSLQQTQRFANALASAELVKREMNIEGAPFSLGFFVGQGATPNRIKVEPRNGEPDPDDSSMPYEYQTLDYCPFCRKKSIEMAFNRRLWKLEHRCVNDDCEWPHQALPVYVVDEEIYRFLPTVIVGTLDKAASISMQAAMRGMVGSPLGVCSDDGHGYTYAPRKSRPNGCLVPGCRGTTESLKMAPELYAPSYRLQDELHLLRDSLGAVDAHYEALYDGLQQELSGRKPKILASSATLSGYEKQVDVLYRRAARVFPVPPPRAGGGFWTYDTNEIMRRFVAIAPRGVTIEYTVDRLLTELQKVVRELAQDKSKVCADIGIDVQYADDILSLYGTDVVYGNTLRDLEASMRSIETQLQATGVINTASLTGKTDFAEVRKILERLEKPEADFSDRVHVITASSMMSHGVDVDRLNVMVMLGIPLSAAEFIQATARVGRKYPGIVFVIHKIGRERDAGIFSSFRQFVAQGDRFVEPIPITRRSRRVLERTISGLEFARLLMVHEAISGVPLTTAKSFRQYVANGGFDVAVEFEAIRDFLQLEGELDGPMRRDLEDWFRELSYYIQTPPTEAVFPSDLSPTGSPMLSLRDVDTQVPVIGKRV